MHDMPSGHDGHLRHLRLLGILGYWMDDMPSGHPGHLGHLSHLSHPSHLSHLGYLGTIGNLDTLNPYSLDPALADSPLEAFITELDPEDPGPSEGYYKDDLLNPLPIDTPLLLPCLNQHYTRQIALKGQPWTFPLDALKGHSSFSEIPWHRL
jgi:hypothetical protein